MRWRINYYLNESAQRTGAAAFSETINGDENYVISWAQHKIRTSNFKFYDIQQL